MTDELKNAAQVCDDFAAPDMAAALRGQPVQAGEVDERVAFEARVVKEAGEGAIAKWLGTESYENSRVQDNRLGWVWCLEHLAGQPAAQATPEPGDDAQIRAIGEGLRCAHDHIEMHKLDRSHCKDAERIREGLAAFSAYKKRGDFVAAPEPVHCESCGGAATHESGPDETDLPGAYCDSCGPSAKATPTPQQAAGEPVGEVVRDTLGRNGRPWLGVTWAPGIDLPQGTKLYTHPAPAVPEGFALVPVEPTHEMTMASIGPICDANKETILHLLWTYGPQCYRAMLAAAQAKGADHG
ncbi:MAG TPA: hypothetical protein VFH49_09795 [Aquabacterium sp.]|nr:hypothetical protein [Aquabacterium sp.]